MVMVMVHIFLKRDNSMKNKVPGSKYKKKSPHVVWVVSTERIHSSGSMIGFKGKNRHPSSANTPIYFVLNSPSLQSGAQVASSDALCQHVQL